ncbi:bifunctional beta-cystathionase/maltose regulon repressor [Bifidobacterium pseudolongum subsp. globosum]|uniref:cysteine-S-conjugate beta-lyase n=1 Tax=Bifidobacterium pseudolongum subsp. globosum TaxID=1690 RepID=A0A4Q5A1A2_9BIFI|nr:MalY/PatB family protein [Bifidobacterium pseudolongum]RYQ10407.1 bifunctional beta-cystathionase/maltose regulon repressor [Bifidobacterium pseudolongum subsp. globosum]
MDINERIPAFDDAVDRTSICSMKWDVAEGELPMWVADMDFATAPCIVEALRQRVSNGTFGYTDVPPTWNAAVAQWWGTRYGMSVEQSHITFTTGVIPAISSLVRSLTNVAEKVVIQPPVYNIFTNSIVNNGRRVLNNPLRYVDGAYSMDFADLERKLSDPLTRLMILCNPQNPSGNVWSADDLARIGELCARHDVTVISDEVHCDIVRPGMVHTPFAAVNDLNRSICVTCSSPSKAFNVAGLQSAYFICDDEGIRARAVRGVNTDEVAEPNDFAVFSTIAAYTQGAAWLEQLRRVVQRNKDHVMERLKRDCPGLIRMVPSDATYLAWIDCSGLLEHTGERTAERLCTYLREHTGLVLSYGGIYGANGERFLRMNLGTRADLVIDGTARLIDGTHGYLNA